MPASRRFLFDMMPLLILMHTPLMLRYDAARAAIAPCHAIFRYAAIDADIRLP